MTNKLKFSNLFTILSVLVCFALSVTLADLLSSVITVGFFSNSTAKIDTGFDIYAVSLYQTATKPEANEYAAIVWGQGGAGFVWQNGGAFYVLASAYENQNDAVKVHENLESQKVPSEVIKLSFGKISFKEEYSNSEKEELSSAVSSYKNSFKKLYDISVSLDTSIITETQAKLDAGQILSDVTKSRSNFETKLKNKKNSETIYLGVKFKDYFAAVQKLASDEKLSETQTYSSLIKYTYIKILSIYNELAIELA